MDAEVQDEQALDSIEFKPSDCSSDGQAATTAEPGNWLTEDEQRAWRALVAVVVLLPHALDTQLDRDAKLSHFEYGALALLSEAPDYTLRMSQLASLTDSSLSRLSHVASRLEARGAITRTTCPQDRRANNATLTQTGLELVTKAAPGHVRHVRELIFDQLSDEQVGQLEAIAETIRRKLDPDNTMPSPLKPRV